MMRNNGHKILAAGGTGGRNEVKFFEAAYNEEVDSTEEGIFGGGFKASFSITDFSGGV